MATIKQGSITSLTESGNKNIKASIRDVSGQVSIDTVIPERLRTKNILKVGTGVAFVVFDDNTSLLLGRLDGIESAPT